MTGLVLCAHLQNEIRVVICIIYFLDCLNVFKVEWRDVQYNEKKIEEKKGDGQKNIVNKNGPFCVQKLRNYVWRLGKIKGIHESEG